MIFTIIIKAVHADKEERGNIKLCTIPQPQIISLKHYYISTYTFSMQILFAQMGDFYTTVFSLV
jgi:hypothetical protein